MWWQKDGLDGWEKILLRSRFSNFQALLEITSSITDTFPTPGMYRIHSLGLLQLAITIWIVFSNILPGHLWFAFGNNNKKVSERKELKAQKSKMNNLIICTKIRNAKSKSSFSYLFIVEMQNIWNKTLFLQKPVEGSITYSFHFPFK